MQKRPPCVRYPQCGHPHVEHAHSFARKFVAGSMRLPSVLGGREQHTSITRASTVLHKSVLPPPRPRRTSAADVGSLCLPSMSHRDEVPAVAMAAHQAHSTIMRVGGVQGSTWYWERWCRASRCSSVSVCPPADTPAWPLHTRLHGCPAVHPPQVCLGAACAGRALPDSAATRQSATHFHVPVAR